MNLKCYNVIEEKRIEMKILLIEDEKKLAEAIQVLLEQSGYCVDSVSCGEEGLELILKEIYDLLIVDWMLPKISGLEIVKKAREIQLNTPCLILSAKSTTRDKVMGLDAGADDYLEKPFAKEELLARVRALLRRKDAHLPSDAIVFGDLIMNKDLLTLSCGDKTLKLTMRESEVFLLLVQRKKMITSKELIIERLWGYDSDAEDNHVEVYISFLRKKIKFLNSRVQIMTTRGVGYALKDENHV